MCTCTKNALIVRFLYGWPSEPKVGYVGISHTNRKTDTHAHPA